MTYAIGRAGKIVIYKLPNYSKFINSTFAGFAVLTATCYCCNVDAAEFQSDTTVLRDDIVYNVNADGTATTNQTESVRIDTHNGVKEHGQVSFRYSTSLEELDILGAYTTTPDGKRIDVTPDEIRSQQSPESAEAPIFDDGRVKTIVFPGVEVGATVTFDTRRTQKKALFPGNISTAYSFWDNKAFKSARLTVHAPAMTKLYVDAVGMDGGLVKADDGGWQTWQWSMKDTPARASEAASPERYDRSPRVVISSFPDYKAVGAAYLQRARPRAAITPAIQALADQITFGVTDRRTQAEALYRWVSTNIRYVAIYLGFGGVVPHSAQEIMDTRYGDCKDHTTLLEALLAAKGIRSSPVLVNAGGRYWLPTAADPLAVFNHAITYLPEFKLYVDSTASVAMFGTLPLEERGKPALIADDGTGQAALVTLPLSSPESDRVNVQTKITLDELGNVAGTSIVKNEGAFDLLARSIFASLPPQAGPQFAARLLTLTGQNGSGDFRHNDVRDLTQSFSYTTQFELPDYAQFPGPGALRVPSGLTSFSSISVAFEPFGPTTRQSPLVFFGRHISEKVEINLPNDVKVASLPKPVQITSPFGTYTSDYSQTGQSITVTRTLDITTHSSLIDVGQYSELRKMALAVKRDIATQFMY